MMTRILLLSAILFGTFAQTAQADEFDPSKTTLQCSINRSETLFVQAQEQSVWFLEFSPNPLPLKLELSSFNVYRCPYCYGFTGSLNGRTYEGTTVGNIDAAGQMTISLNLKIDGEQQQEIGCLRPNQN